MTDREIVSKIFIKALESVEPELIVREHVAKIHSELSGESSVNLLVAGFGKASYRMARATEDVLGDLISGGIVVTKYGHARASQSVDGNRQPEELKKIKVYEAGHPIPDENGFRATEEIIKLLHNADENTLVLCLISGGGSALFVSPYNGINLAEKQEITNQLLRAGADITELNAVRKHLSKVKGGRLAELTYPARIISLMISDVIGDRLDVIASGPTAPDISTFHEAMDVINRYDLYEHAPRSVIDVLKRGSEGLIPETPKPENPVFRNVTNIIIGSNMIALEAARDAAQSSGFDSEILSSEISGEAREVGRWLAKKALEKKTSNHSICFISGGETTVTVKGQGKGGRNTELALSFAMEIDGVEGVTMLSAGTDGTDGPTDAAGAIVDGQTIKKARSLGLDPQEYLDNNDSYNFFKKIDSLLITGPTGTNVMDVQVVLIQKPG